MSKGEAIMMVSSGLQKFGFPNSGEDSCISGSANRTIKNVRIHLDNVSHSSNQVLQILPVLYISVEHSVEKIQS